MASLVSRGVLGSLLSWQTPSLSHQMASISTSSLRLNNLLKPNFGIMFDIDGVIVRGKNILPTAPAAFDLLWDKKKEAWRVPTIFVTNAGNTLRLEKAEKLSSYLNVPIREEQVVMSHSPLKMFTEYHNKHVLVMGQGHVEQIASSLGFTNVTTMDQLRHIFPTLDGVDHKRRRAAPCSFNHYFPRIEAVVMFGEPIRWETSLQLLLDVLMTDGHPSSTPRVYPQPHLPVLACNMDLQWMSEAPLPRLGHGAFLLCVENLYKKLTGHDLVYDALVGKPSEITYTHGEHVLQQEALGLGLYPLKTLYCIGDNLCTDIFGANLYNRYLSRANQNRSVAAQSVAAQSVPARSVAAQNSRSSERLVGVKEPLGGAETCISVLVETGVFSADGQTTTMSHSPRDFLPVEESWSEPGLCSSHVLEAVQIILRRENLASL